MNSMRLQLSIPTFRDDQAAELGDVPRLLDW